MNGGTPSAPEFSRVIDRRRLPGAPLELTASEAERAALAARFGLVEIGHLVARIALAAEGEMVTATGSLEARVVQTCAVTGDDLPVAIDEPFAVRFAPEGSAPVPDEEIELDEEDLDEIAYAGTAFDLGEAVAQSLALALDPYATGPEADRVRERHGLAGSSPQGPLQAALGAALKRD